MEIKSRVWNKANNTFLDNYFLNSNGRVYKQSTFGLVDISSNTLVITYSTKVKDRFGRDIFEGDILKYVKIENNKKNVLFVIVKYDKFLCRYVLSELNSYNIYNLTEDPKIYEYIGNIFENKNMLTR